MQNNLLSKFESLANDKELLKKIFNLAIYTLYEKKVIIKNEDDFIQIIEIDDFFNDPAHVYIYKDLTIKAFFRGKEMITFNDDQINKIFSEIKNV